MRDPLPPDEIDDIAGERPRCVREGDHAEQLAAMGNEHRRPPLACERGNGFSPWFRQQLTLLEEARVPIERWLAVHDGLAAAPRKRPILRAGPPCDPALRRVRSNRSSERMLR